MDLHVFKTPVETVQGLADFFVEKVNEAIAAKGFCNVVLSGGNSPKSLYQLLVSDQYKNEVEWNKIYFFFGDERNVPFENNDNNGRMTAEYFFNPLAVAASHVFYINTSLMPEAAAENYSQIIQQHFKNQPPLFDLTILGIGDNAHTASLFPYTSVLRENKKLVSAVYVEELKSYRITMTAPLINQSQTIAFLVYGETKASALFNILEGEKNIEKYPAQLIESNAGATHWFIDKQAAVLLIDQKK